MAAPSCPTYVHQKDTGGEGAGESDICASSAPTLSPPLSSELNLNLPHRREKESPLDFRRRRRGRKAEKRVVERLWPPFLSPPCMRLNFDLVCLHSTVFCILVGPPIYIYKREVSVCLFVCLFGWRPNYWMDLNQIWHGPPTGNCG